MYPQIFSDIHHVIDDQKWTGARAHKARALYQFQQSTPDFIDLEDWTSKSPDVNVTDYCIWSLLLTKLQNCRHDTHSIDDFKMGLVRA